VEVVDAVHALTGNDKEKIRKDMNVLLNSKFAVLGAESGK